MKVKDQKAFPIYSKCSRRIQAFSCVVAWPLSSLFEHQPENLHYQRSIKLIKHFPSVFRSYFSAKQINKTSLICLLRRNLMKRKFRPMVELIKLMRWTGRRKSCGERGEIFYKSKIFNQQFTFWEDEKQKEKMRETLLSFNAVKLIMKCKMFSVISQIWTRVRYLFLSFLILSFREWHFSLFISNYTTVLNELL